MCAATKNVQRCGWIVSRVLRTPNIAQPRANASSATPEITCSLAPANTTRVSSSAPTSPTATDPATTRAIGPDPSTSGSGRCVVLGGTAVVTIAMPPFGESSEVDPSGYLDDEDRRDHEVDRGAERRPPSGVGHEVSPLLPVVLETVARVPDHEQPG